MNEVEERARKALLDLLPEDAAPDWNEVRRGAGRREHPRLRAGRVGGVAGALAGVTAAAVGLVLMLPGGDPDPSASPVTTEGTSTGAPAPPVPSGELTFAAIHAVIADLNARYSECMQANGATLVAFPEGDGWSWTGATDAAMKACAPLLEAGPEYMKQDAVREVRSRPDYLKFLRCMLPVFKAMPPTARFTAKEEAAARQCSEGLNG